MALHVGLLHYTTPPVVGGVESVLAQHARLLADAGHRVRVITGRGGGGDRRAEVVRLPLADTRQPAIRAVRVALDAGRIPADFHALADELEAGLRAAADDLDVLIAHNVCALHFDLPLTEAVRRVAGRQGGPRVIAWQHDLAATSDRFADQLHPGQPWDLVRRPWPGVTYVTISEARRADQAGLFGVPLEAIRVVPNGIDVESFLALHPTTRRFVASLGLETARPILLVPVRITPRKNLELAIGVLAALRRGGEDARLIVTGPPDPHDPAAAGHIDHLRAVARAAGAEAAVHLLAADHGRRTPARVVADLYRVADVLFLPSRDEGFGLPILEAAACRLPIVCADLPPLREIAGDDATYVDPDADPETVAETIRELLAGGPVARLGARVRTTYGWRAIARDRIEPLLDEVMSGSVSPRRGR